MAYIQSLRGQQWLLPPSIEDLIPGDHVCYLVEEFMDSLDYDSFDVKYSGPGHPAYHPRILLKLLVMGVLDRVRSSRRLSRNARENIVYLYLSEKLAPDFRTISDFRKNNPRLIKEVFKHTVTLAKRGVCWIYPTSPRTGVRLGLTQPTRGFSPARNWIF